MCRACLVNLHSHCFLDNRTWIQYEAPLIPVAQTALLNLVSMHTSGFPIPFLATFWISECPRGTLFETHSMDGHENVDGIFSGHYPVNGRTALLFATLPGRSHSARPELERKEMHVFYSVLSNCFGIDFYFTDNKTET